MNESPDLDDFAFDAILPLSLGEFLAKISCPKRFAMWLPYKVTQNYKYAVYSYSFSCVTFPRFYISELR
jgi:uncharacterized membrane protein